MSRLAKEIQETFDLEKLRLEATQKLNADEWPAYQKLREDFDGRRNFAKRAYELEYDDRVAMARTRIINKAGAKDRSFKPRWMGGDKFDKEAINKQAHRQVRHAYLNEHVRIDRDEAEELMQLIGSSEHTRLNREKPRRDFERATDRRVSGDRRIAKQTRKRSIS